VTLLGWQIDLLLHLLFERYRLIRATLDANCGPRQAVAYGAWVCDARPTVAPRRDGIGREWSVGPEPRDAYAAIYSLEVCQHQHGPGRNALATSNDARRVKLQVSAYCHMLLKFGKFRGRCNGDEVSTPKSIARREMHLTRSAHQARVISAAGWYRIIISRLMTASRSHHVR
jgi:hypothetical protein